MNNKVESEGRKENLNKDKVKKHDFVELEFTGYLNGKPFDSNIEEDLKEISPEAKPSETIVSVGNGMVVPGLDKALEGKEIGKRYEIDVPYQEGFGPRKKELVKIIPLKAFTEKNVNPKVGAMLALDNHLVKVLAVNGARVTIDFNNPLSGKNLEYKFTIVKKVTDTEKKAKALFEVLFKFVPEFEVKDKIIMKGPKELENIAKIYSKKFKEIVGKPLGFEEKAEKEPEREGKEEAEN
jgi:FKBP-type peptidyl-prolyl cis-trans isomerase 2